MGAFAPGNLTAQGSLDCRIGAVRMQTGGRLGALGPGRQAAGGARHLALRPAMAWHAACLFSAAACSLVCGIREVTGGGAGLRAALRPEGHGAGEPAPPHRGGEGFPALSEQAAPSGAVGSHLWDLFPFLIEGVTAAILRSDYFEDPNHI